ncbi:MAG: ABC transporter ATP-binding protein [Anaerolineales bacterium]
MDNHTLVNLQNVTFTYEGDIVALSEINLTVKRGEFVVVLGANGAGKSTLCYLISGIVPHIYGGRRKGDVVVGDIDPWDEPLYTTAQRCGLLMQDPEVQLFMPTIKAELAFGPANLGIPREEIARRSKEALDLVRMSGLEERNPRDLSGGQKQRTALASVLTMNPQILVLDEPTSQLDPLGRWEVGEAIEELKHKGDLAIIMTTHETEEILHLADQVLVLDHGKTVLQGSPSEVFAHVAQLDMAGIKTPAMIRAQIRLLTPATNPKENAPSVKTDLSIADLAGEIKSAVREGKLTVKQPDAIPHTSQSTLSPESQPILEARALTVEFPGPPRVTALQGINLRINQGEFVGVIGQNGSGKSTLVKSFVGLLRPQHGEVLYKGQNIHKLSVGEIARRIGLVLQNPDYQLFTSSCRDEVRFGLQNIGVPESEIPRLIEEALDLVGLKDEADLFPFRLSFGDRRKLAVAATIALQPEVLIMDEPTTAQDHRGRYQLADLALELHQKKGSTIIMITHDVDLIARYAQRLIVLHAGNILLDGKADQVFVQIEELKKSFVVPPFATQLAMHLESLGIPQNIMTLDELFTFFNPNYPVSN